MPPKKRKATYLVRNEEAAALKAQVEVLQREVAEFKLYGERVPAGVRTEARLLEDTLLANGLLDGIVQQQHAVIASAQSMLVQYKETQSTHPLHTYIHLPEAWDERRRVLLRLKEDKFARSCKYLLARSQQMDLFKRHTSASRYEDSDGNFCCERFQIRQIDDAKSLRQAFDAAMFAQSSMEILISEKLGHLTLREDYDSLDGDMSISNFRLVSDAPNGLTYETNKVLCAKYFSEREGSGSGPCAIMAIDFVDKDDRYPYKPADHVRKDITAVIILTEGKRKKPKILRVADRKACGGGTEEVGDRGGCREGTGKHSEEEELVVVMQHAAFVKIHKPAFEVSPQDLHALEEAYTSWGEVIVQSASGRGVTPV